MIQTSSAKEGILIAQQLESKGLKLVAEPGSLLGILVSKLTPCLITQQTKASEYLPNPVDICSMSDNFGARDKGQATTFEMVLDNTAIEIAMAVRSHISFAKNVVTPVIKEFVEQLSQDFQAMAPAPGAEFTIKRARYPQPLLNDSLIEHLKSYAEVLAPSARPVVNAGEKTFSELSELIIQSIPGLQEETAAWLSELPQSLVSEVWASRFTSAGGAITPAANMDYAVDVQLLTYIYAGLLKDNPGADCGLSLAQWNALVGDIHNSAGRDLNQILATKASYDTLGIVIHAWDDQVITVNPSVYDEWIAAGGTDNLLISAAMQPRVPRTVFELDSQRQALHASWQQHVMLTRSAFESNKYLRMKSLVQYRLPLVVQDNANTIYNGFLPKVDGKIANYEALQVHQEFHKRLKVLVGDLKVKDFDDLWELSLNLVCDSVFFFTDAKTILLSRQRAIKMNPDISPDDAEFLSRCEYITQYGVDQLTLTTL
jgi:hypothetical protein